MTVSRAEDRHERDAPTRARARVLLADGTADTRGQVERLLGTRYDVEAVGDASGALDAARRIRPDIIIAGTTMPAHDGLGLLSALRADPHLCEIPVLVLSNDAQPEGAVATEAGPDEYWLRPFPAGELLARVDASLEVAALRQRAEERVSAVNRELLHRVNELEALLEILPIGIGIAHDRACTSIRINPAFAALLGLPPSANASKTAPGGARPDNFICTDDTGREIPGHELPMQVAAARGEAVKDVEFNIVHRDGRRVRLLEFAVPLFDEHNEPRGSVGAFIDITERRRVELRQAFLVALDDATRTLADPDAITGTSVRLLGDHLAVNRCAYAEVRADGFRIRGDHNRDVQSIVGRYPLTAFGSDMIRLLRHGEPFVVTDAESDPRLAEVIEAYRETCACAVICVPLLKDGELVGAMAVTHAQPRRWAPDEVELVNLVANRCWESIERARVTRTWRESEERVRLAVQAAGVGYWSWNLDTGETEIDDTCAALFGIPPAGATHEAVVLSRIHPDDRPAVRASVDDVVSGRGPYNVEFRVVRDDGSIGWLSGTGRLVHDDSARRRLTGVNIDISDRKRLEAQRELLLVRERTARAEAEQANQLKDEFLATLSHELRTPLNAIFGWSQMLQWDTPANVLQQGLAAIERNARMQKQLVEDLLDMSRIVAGKLRVAMRPLDLGPVVQAALEAIEPAAAVKHIGLNVEIEAAIPIMGDEDRLQQIAWNLLSNAVKFTPDGGRIRIEVRHQDSEAVLRVSDTGVGISAEFLPHVFERFRQAESKPSRRFGGLGLGLSIVKQLVELHGGAVRVTSDGPDRGATFEVRFPALDQARLATAARPPKITSAPGSGPTVPELTGVAVLVVDDDADSRELVQTVLGERGVTVIAVGSADDALNALALRRPDVLLSDIGMPLSDGYDLIRTIRALDDQNLRTIPAVAVTAFARPEDRTRALSSGFHRHLHKPIDPNELLRIVGELASRVRQ